VCGDNGVPEEAFRRMNLLFFLGLRRSGGVLARRIATVWESDGTDRHQAIQADEAARLDGGASRLVTADERRTARAVIDKLMASGVRTIEEVRTFLVRQ
jgi:hypothetical protein